jgi:uncharacterized protein (TIGR00255 family)
MTGSAEISVAAGSRKIKIFIKSVNHKFLESSYRSSFPLAGFEKEMDRILGNKISRGRVDVQIDGSVLIAEPEISNHALIQYKKAAAEINGSPGNAINADTQIYNIFRLPGVITLKERISPEFKPKEFLKGFTAAVDLLQESRLKEGAGIQKKLKNFINSLIKNKKIIDKEYLLIRKRDGAELKKEAFSLLGINQVADKDIHWTPAFLEWMDRQSIAEESDRLEMHLGLFQEIMDQNEGSEDRGRRLDFTVQEMQREINTISSKSRDAKIRHRIVDMKSSIENLREQLRNIC